LFAKRLEKGRFIWPQATEGTVHLSRAQLSMLLEGIDRSHDWRTHRAFTAWVDGRFVERAALRRCSRACGLADISLMLSVICAHYARTFR